MLSAGDDLVYSFVAFRLCRIPVPLRNSLFAGRCGKNCGGLIVGTGITKSIVQNWDGDCMITKMIRLRPHHGLCIQHFTGKGYSAAFVANMTHVIAVLRAMPETQIELTADMDVLCACCPHNQEGACESSPKPSLYDQAVLQCCGLQMGQRLSWKEFQKHVSQRILERGLLEQVCRGCQWLSLCQETTKRIYSQ